MICRTRKIRKRLHNLICVIGLILLLVCQYLTRANFIKSKVDLCEAMKREDNRTVKYIFDLTKWHAVMEEEYRLSGRDETRWCDVPAELRFIAKMMCRLYDMSNCARLPCRVIYSSPTTVVDVKCGHDTSVKRTNGDRLKQSGSYFQCKRGFSLDLFTSASEKQSYPSLIADPYLRFSDDVYTRVLHNQYRSCTSMWGFEFTHESIIYYPWTADRDKLALFDVTFGYDRSIHDFPPRPFLLTYAGRLTYTAQRVSFQEAMRSKKPIHSENAADVYWTSRARNSITRNDTPNASHIRAPILWMNSNCIAKSGRTQYMKKLMKHIAVDNFGNCGEKIRSLPEHIVRIQKSANRTLKHIATYSWEAGKLALSREYLFTIAIENSLTYDYISEKLWQPLIVGSVPIYLGAPNVYDWLPCRTDCIIDLRKFKTPADAALFIRHVARNQTLYQSYHQWRNEPVSDKFQNILNYFTRASNYTLDCALCEMSQRVSQGEDPKEIKKDLKTTIGHF